MCHYQCTIGQQRQKGLPVIWVTHILRSNMLRCYVDKVFSAVHYRRRSLASGNQCNDTLSSWQRRLEILRRNCYAQTRSINRAYVRLCVNLSVNEWRCKEQWTTWALLSRTVYILVLVISSNYNNEAQRHLSIPYLYFRKRHFRKENFTGKQRCLASIVSNHEWTHAANYRSHRSRGAPRRVLTKLTLSLEQRLPNSEHGKQEVFAATTISPLLLYNSIILFNAKLLSLDKSSTGTCNTWFKFETY